ADHGADHRPIPRPRPALGAVSALQRLERGGPEEDTVRGERGSALVMAVFVLMLLTSMGAALLFVSENEMKTGRVDLRSKEVFYTSEAGLEDARETLRVVNLSGATEALRSS